MKTQPLPTVPTAHTTHRGLCHFSIQRNAHNGRATENTSSRTEDPCEFTGPRETQTSVHQPLPRPPCLFGINGIKNHYNQGLDSTALET